MADDPISDLYKWLKQSKPGLFLIGIALVVTVLFAIWSSLPDETKIGILGKAVPEKEVVKRGSSELAKPAESRKLPTAGRWQFVSNSGHRIVWDLVAEVQLNRWTASGRKEFIDGALATIGEKNTTLTIEVEIVESKATGRYREETPVASHAGDLEWNFSSEFRSLSGRMFSPDGRSVWPISGVLREAK